MVASGEHVLATAPTGSGKTLAAFLYGLDRLVSEAWEGGTTRLLYISPLKALGVDINRNLRRPLAGLQQALGNRARPVQVGIRTGDTDPAQRQR